MTYNKVPKVTSCLLIGLAILYVYFNFNITIEKKIDMNVELKHNTEKKPSIEKTDKWIVIISVSEPTKDIMKMAELKQWRIVVVADEKTPKNWNYKNCVFLSVEMQRNLNYTIIQHVPYKSYTRKMIGYLFAIENGAKYIYDTDDNIQIKSDLDLFDYTNETSSLICLKPQLKNNDTSDELELFNVYSHFGRSDIWPRGYPLEFVNRKSKADYRLCRKIKTPIIQQGLVDQEADVDAIYRMIFIKNKTAGLDVKFDPFAPPMILGKNVYCPFNSQNTLFHYDAFWALMLPTTVTFRVTDIWRGYWAQKLLHLTGNHLGFYGSNARQSRYPHSYMKDYLEEDQLYTDSLRLVEMLQRWNCSNNHFRKCITELSELLTDKNIWKSEDFQLTTAWINDLSNIGYHFPVAIKNDDVSEIDYYKCRNAMYTSNLQTQINFKSTQVDSLMKINELCDKINSSISMYNSSDFQMTAFDEPLFNDTKKVILVVIFNKNYNAHISLLQILYNSMFANVIFCGKFPKNVESISHSLPFFEELWPNTPSFSYVNLTKDEIYAGYFHYVCLNIITDMKIPNVDGYFMIADDMLFNFWNHFDTNKVLFPQKCGNRTDKWHWWRKGFGEVNLRSLSNYLNESILTNQANDLIVKLFDIVMDPIFCYSDIYYVPQSMTNQYQLVSQLLFDHKVFLEIAVPRIMYLLGWGNSVPFDEVHMLNDSDTSMLTGKLWWGYGQGGQHGFHFYNESHTFLHTVKFSKFAESEHLDKFCNIYIRTMLKGINNAVSKEN